MRTTAALGFIDLCATEPDVNAVIDGFMDAIGVFGFSCASSGAWVGAGAAKAHRFYFNTWPKDWFEIYAANGFVLNDPMVLETLRRMTPFRWSEMADARTFTVEGAAVVAAGRAYGWSEVVGFPIHGPASYQGLVSVASLDPVSSPPVEAGLLRTMAMAVHDRAHSAIGFGEASRPEVHLTPREVECMRWVAGGKTDAEIGIIFGVAASTAHFHVERVKKKLDCHSRSEAVALLVLAGAI